MPGRRNPKPKGKALLSEQMEYLRIYPTLDSTNKEAQRLLAQGSVKHGLTLFTRYQTAGRGQMGRTWFAEPDLHLAMSLIYLPQHLHLSQLPTIGMKTSLAIVLALEKLNPELHPLIKWPNDIYVNGHKLCGILIENALSGNKVQHCIIGIGMNIKETRFPPEIPNATSLALLTDQSYEPVEVAKLLREEILTCLDRAPLTWKTDYDSRIYGLHQLQSFARGEIIFEATIRGISMDGHILLESADGTIKGYANHEVRWMG